MPASGETAEVRFFLPALTWGKAETTGAQATARHGGDSEMGPGTCQILCRLRTPLGHGIGDHEGVSPGYPTSLWYFVFPLPRVLAHGDCTSGLEAANTEDMTPRVTGPFPCLRTLRGLRLHT